MLFTSPTSNDDIEGQRDEQRCKVEGTVREAQVNRGPIFRNGFGGSLVGKEERSDSDQKKRDAKCDDEIS